MITIDNINNSSGNKSVLSFAGNDYINSWLQVDVGMEKKIDGVITQGRPEGGQHWVTEYQIYYGNSTSSLTSNEEMVDCFLTLIILLFNLNINYLSLPISFILTMVRK